MRISFDEEAGALYVTLSEGIVARTVTVDAGTLVDVDERGNAVGIEVVRPAREWPVDAIAEAGNLGPEILDQLRHLNRAGTDGGPFRFGAGRRELAAAG